MRSTFKLPGAPARKTKCKRARETGAVVQAEASQADDEIQN